MDDPLVTLTADLYDTRKTPPRPAIFIAGQGSSVRQSLADRFGGQYAQPGGQPQTAKRTPANKKRTPAGKEA